MRAFLCSLSLLAAAQLAACGSPDESGGFEIAEIQQSLGSSCTVPGIAFGAWWSQNDPAWSSVLLGDSSTDTIGQYGCVVSCLAMAYNDAWQTPTTPPQLNASAKSAGCFWPGSSLVDVRCAINSRGGPHFVTTIAGSAPTADVANAICAGHPVMVDVTWGGGHKMLIYRYDGGNPASMSSYVAVDPWDGIAKRIGSYVPIRFRKLQ